MHCDGNDSLNVEYCYADGTFKRCPGFVTLSAFVYVELLRKNCEAVNDGCRKIDKDFIIIIFLFNSLF